MHWFLYLIIYIGSSVSVCLGLSVLKYIQLTTSSVLWVFTASCMALPVAEAKLQIVREPMWHWHDDCCLLPKAQWKWELAPDQRCEPPKQYKEIQCAAAIYQKMQNLLLESRGHPAVLPIEVIQSQARERIQVQRRVWADLQQVVRVVIHAVWVRKRSD